MTLGEMIWLWPEGVHLLEAGLMLGSRGKMGRAGKEQAGSLKRNMIK